MADIISLAEFEFDSNRLSKGIEEMQKKLFELSKTQQELNKETKALTKEIETQEKVMKTLADSAQEDTDQYKDLSSNVAAMRKQQEQLFISTKNLSNERKQLNSEYNQAVKIQNVLKTADGEVLSIQKAIDKALNQEVKTREQAKQSIQQLNKIKDQLNTENEEEIKWLDKLNEKVNQNNNLLKESGSEREKQISNVGNYSNSIKDAFADLDIFNGGLEGFIQRSNEAGGAGKLVSNSLGQMKAGLMALIATPAGAFLAILAGIGLIAKEVYQYNMEVLKTDKLIRGITKTTAEVTTQIRNMSTAIVEVFGVDLEETIQTAKVLVNEFGLTYQEAMNQINEGLIRGQDGNKEYLDSLREYSTFFASAGYSVEEFRSIVSAGYDLGIYTDKLPDAIKEFGISLTEQTKATKDALINSFGTEFTNDLLSRVNEGKIGINDALKEISNQAQTSNIDLQQQAQLTAQVFRGAGEDAGGALKIFNAVNKAYSDQTRELTDVEQKTKDLFEANLELAEAKDAALKSDALIEFKKEFELLWTRAKIVFYDFIAYFTTHLRNMKTSLFVMKDTAIQIFNQLKSVFTNFDITDPLKSLKELSQISFQGAFSKNLKATLSQQAATKKLSDEQKALHQQNELNAGKEEARRKAQEKAQEEAEKRKSQLDKAAKASHDAEVKRIDLLIAKQKEALDLWIAQQGDKARTLQEQLDLEKQTSDKSKAILDNELKNKKISQEKYDLEILKLKQSTSRLQAQIAIEAAKSELDNYIYDNQTKLKNGQILTDELLNQELERNKLIQAEKDAFAQSQFDNELISQTEFDKLKLENQRAYLEQDKALKAQYKLDERETEKMRIAEDAKANILRLEEDNASQFDIKREQADAQYLVEKLDLDQKLADELITKENHQLALDNITAAHSQVRKQIADLEEKTKLDLAKDTFSGIAQAVGEQTAMGKAAGIATATINTYQAVSEVWKSPSVFPEPYNTILKAIQTGVTVASGLSAVKKITSVKTPSVKGYATGGMITDGFGIRRSNGDNVLITAKTGEAILNEQQQNFIGKDLLSLAGVPGFAKGGRVGYSATATSAVNSSLTQSKTNFDMNNFMLRIEQAVQVGSQVGSQQGSSQGAQQGISQLSSNRTVQGSSFN